MLVLFALSSGPRRALTGTSHFKIVCVLQTFDALFVSFTTYYVSLHVSSTKFVLQNALFKITRNKTSGELRVEQELDCEMSKRW
uniref:Uncharacterized protein n=1 Tax=Cucumis melo TaxID=3656 RepID=A0A9I9EC46_CUCME